MPINDPIQRRVYERRWYKKKGRAYARAKWNRYRAAHLDAARAAGRRKSRHRRATHPGEDAAYTRRWHRQHPELKAKLDNERRTRKRGNGGSWTVDEWIALKAFYGNKCLCCHKTEKQLKRLGRKLVPDHVLPLAKKGRNDIANLQPLCHGRGGCNNRKGARHIDYRRDSRATRQ